MRISRARTPEERPPLALLISVTLLPPDLFEAEEVLDEELLDVVFLEEDLPEEDLPEEVLPEELFLAGVLFPVLFFLVAAIYPP